MRGEERALERRRELVRRTVEAAALAAPAVLEAPGQAPPLEQAVAYALETPGAG